MNELEKKDGGELAVIDDNAVGSFAIPLKDIEQSLKEFRQFIAKMLQEGVDYGKIPGCGDKPTLLKPGAEKLLIYHNYTNQIECTKDVQNWDTGFFYYVYKCTVYNSRGRIMAQCEGSANSYEPKFRYRWNKSAKIPPKEETDKLKAAGKGKFRKDGANWIWFERIENNDLAEKENTIRKIAQKRALTGATLIATRASESFTCDIEDMESTQEAQQQESLESYDWKGAKPVEAKIIDPSPPEWAELRREIAFPTSKHGHNIPWCEFFDDTLEELLNTDYIRKIPGKVEAIEQEQAFRTNHPAAMRPRPKDPLIEEAAKEATKPKSQREALTMKLHQAVSVASGKVPKLSMMDKACETIYNISLAELDLEGLKEIADDPKDFVKKYMAEFKKDAAKA